jgi:4'-phosphopantetheinyl transferase
LRILPEDEIHLWFAFAGDVEDSYLSLLTGKILDADEIARAQRLRRAQDRRLFLTSHLLARTTLSRYRSRPPEEWRFVRNLHGKPELDPETEPAPPQFNLSHTTGLSVFAMTRRAEIGVDVEMVNRPVPGLKLSRRFFSPDEALHLEKLSPERLSEQFFYYWTLKESFLKALGRGFSLSLDSFAFHLSEARPCRIGLSGKKGRYEGWRFVLIQPAQGYIAALSVGPGPKKPVKVACFRALPFAETASLGWAPLGLSEGVECISQGDQGYAHR